MTRFALPALAVTVLLLLALPPFLGLSLQNALTKMLIASLFAAAFNLLAGQAGEIGEGHADITSCRHLFLAGGIFDPSGKLRIGKREPLLEASGGFAGRRQKVAEQGHQFYHGGHLGLEFVW